MTAFLVGHLLALFILVAMRPIISANDECNASNDPNYAGRINLAEGPPELIFHWTLSNVESGEGFRPALVAKLWCNSPDRWLGWGVSKDPSGSMTGSQVIVGHPTVGSGQDLWPVPPIPNPAKYDLRYRGVAGVIPMDEQAQTLLNASIVSDETSTTLTFTKLLDEAGELPIFPDEKVAFVWAVGRSGVKHYHEFRGVVKINLSECGGRAHSVPMKAKVAWYLHGFLAVAAWGFAAPVAVAAAILRRLSSDSTRWFDIHERGNMACLGLTLAAFGVAVFTKSHQSHPGHFREPHYYVGLIITITVVLQVIAARLRPSVGPTSTRRAWEVVHKSVGAAMLAVAVAWQIPGGLQIGVEKVNGPNLAVPYWVWIAFLLVSVLGMKVWSGKRDDYSPVDDMEEGREV